MDNVKYSVRSEVVSTEQQQSKVKVMLCQLTLDHLDYEMMDELLMVRNTLKTKSAVMRLLNVAQRNSVDLVVFPECTIPESLLNDLYEFAANNSIYIVAGSHYKKFGQKYVSVCPIITPYKIFEINKINVAPAEDSPMPDTGLLAGNSTAIFRFSRFGNFAVTVCLDYLDPRLKLDLEVEKIDMLIVPAFNSNTDRFYNCMDSDVNASDMGMYIIYTNCMAGNHGAGKSCVFGQTYPEYKRKLVDAGVASAKPDNQLYQLKDSQEFVVCELDLKHKRPTKPRNQYSGCNFRVIEEDKKDKNGNYDFLKLIKNSDERFRHIDSFYVLPKEYDEIRKTLEEKNVVLILGDPGIGKTYTAVRLLFEYYQKGYSPKWFFGLDKEEREIQSQKLQEYEPDSNEIVYFEDPFGHIQFERREVLIQIFKPLLTRMKANGSKLIVTSRSVVFEEFSAEVLDAEGLKAYSKEMNILKPSYTKAKLKEIAKIYIENLTTWSDNKKMINVLMKAIDNRQLVTPLAIFDTINYNRFSTSERFLADSLRDVKNDDITTQFSYEVKSMQIPSKALLYIVFFLSNIHIRSYQQLYEEILYELRNRIGNFELTHFSTELERLLGVRIQRIGDKTPAFRFSHSIYEEAMVNLFVNDDLCKTIGKTVFSQIYRMYIGLGISILHRLITRYPQVAFDVYKHMQSEGNNNFRDYQLIRLSQRMLFSPKQEFIDESKRLIDIKKLIQSLYDTDDVKTLFYEMLRILAYRYAEVKKLNICVKWNSVFPVCRMRRMNPSLLVNCLLQVEFCDNKALKGVLEQFDKIDVMRAYLMIPVDELRVKFNRLLTGSRYESVYEELKRDIPNLSELDSHEIRYFEILKSTVFTKEGVKGIITIDKGAYKAMKQGARLFPVGVVDVQGSFEYGDLVKIEYPQYPVYFMSLVELSSDFIRKYKGMKTDDIQELTDDISIPVVSRRKYRYRKDVRSDGEEAAGNAYQGG